MENAINRVCGEMVETMVRLQPVKLGVSRIGFHPLDVSAREINLQIVPRLCVPHFFPLMDCLTLALGDVPGSSGFPLYSL
ncbi:MAG: hypothetical protein MUC33_17315 [Desulfobacterales bacterium]|nr:hypothetical protein [Desulfobacterales bacterium]